jgi:ribosomal protein L37AE/L43A
MQDHRHDCTSCGRRFLPAMSENIFKCSSCANKSVASFLKNNKAQIQDFINNNKLERKKDVIRRN